MNNQIIRSNMNKTELLRRISKLQSKAYTIQTELQSLISDLHNSTIKNDDNNVVVKDDRHK